MTPVPRPARPVQPSGAPPPLPGQRMHPNASNPASGGPPPVRRIPQESASNRAGFYAPGPSNKPRPLPHKGGGAGFNASEEIGPNPVPPFPPLAGGGPRRLPAGGSYDRHASVMAALSEVRSNKDQRGGGQGRKPMVGGNSPPPAPAPSSPRKRPPPSGPSAPPPMAPRTSACPAQPGDHRKTAVALSRMPPPVHNDDKPPSHTSLTEDAGQPAKAAAPSGGMAESEVVESKTVARLPVTKVEESKPRSRGEPPPAPVPVVAQSPMSPAIPNVNNGSAEKLPGIKIDFGIIEDRGIHSNAFVPTNLGASLDHVWRERRKMVSLWQSASKKRRGGWLEAVSMKGCSEQKGANEGAFSGPTSPTESLISSFPFALRDSIPIKSEKPEAAADTSGAPATTISYMRIGQLYSPVTSDSTEESERRSSLRCSVVLCSPSHVGSFWDFTSTDSVDDNSDMMIVDDPPPPPEITASIVPAILEPMVVESTPIYPPPPPTMATSPPLNAVPPPPDTEHKSLAMIPPPPPPPPPPDSSVGVMSDSSVDPTLPAILPVPVPPPALRLHSTPILPSPFSPSLVLPPPNVLPAQSVALVGVVPTSDIHPPALARSPVLSHLPARSELMVQPPPPEPPALLEKMSPADTPTAPKTTPPPPPENVAASPETTSVSPPTSIPRRLQSAADIYRVWPRQCRFLVLWGFETCALSHKASTAHIEQLVDFVRSSPEFVGIFGGPKGNATVQGVGNIDRKGTPFPVRWAPVDVDKSSNEKTNLIFRSLFSSRIAPSSDGKRWQGFASNVVPQNSEGHISRPDTLLSALIEFSNPTQAAAFFYANTYSDLTDSWGGRLWSVPDFRGIKFWLHAILSNTSTWCKACLPLAVAQSTLNPPLTDTPSCQTVYLPFLTETDVAQIMKAHSGLEFEHLENASGYHLKVTGDLQWMQQSLTIPISDPSGVQKSPPKLCLLVHQELVGWAGTHLGAQTGYISCWARVAKYVHRIWAELGVLPPDEPAPTEQAPPPQAKVDAIPKKNHASGVVEKQPSADLKKTESIGEKSPTSDQSPKHFVARVGLLVCSIDSEILLTPMLLCSVTDFLRCRGPFVQKMLNPAKPQPPQHVPVKREEPSAAPPAGDDLPPPNTRAKRKLPQPAGNDPAAGPSKRGGRRRTADSVAATRGGI